MDRETWEQEVLAPFIGKTPERETEFTNFSEIPVARVYDSSDIEDLDYDRDLGYPGVPPFTRGVYPTMYRGRLWTMRQYAGYATAEDSNQRYRYLLDQGQTGLSVAFDLPTQMGYDSDQPLVEGEVGKTGVAIDSLEDMMVLMESIPLDKVSTSMTINATAAILLAMYVVVGDEQGVPRDQLRGTVQNDILKEYVARGTYIFPPEPSMRLTTDIFSFCSEELPRFNTISVSGYHIREAGATAVQELAFTLADAIAYVEAAVEAGLDVDRFASRLSFFFNAHSDFFEEICKFRAARRMWCRIMKERFGACRPQSLMLRFHTQTAGSTLTAQQFENNAVRVALQALSAVLGGTQSLHTNSRDEALALPTEESVRLALRTQQIIAYESGAAYTVDPLAGSYYVEWLTNRLEGEASELLERIDAMGGAVAAIESGFFQKEIHESAYRYQREVESKQRSIVGVNTFAVDEEEVEPETLRVDRSVGERQIRRLTELRQERDGSHVTKSLRQLEEAARGRTNLMPAIIECVKRYATLGEICDTLRGVFGTYQEKRSHG
jgi:methylmalonyl-CoA mutase N-terminal domain/subunit